MKSRCHTKPSIRDVEPLETGGVVNRIGISFQDHVAASFLIQMLKEPTLTEVWIETQDDITLLWEVSGNLEVEFVQVKSNELDQLWSLAKLTTHAPGEKSILEKSLEHDRVSEQCRFRVVTKWQVNKELKILTLPLNSPERQLSKSKVKKPIADATKATKFISKNGNGPDFWVQNTMWEVRHDEAVIEIANIQALQEFASSMSYTLTPREVKHGIYEPIIKSVQQAGKTEWKVDAKKKQLLKAEFTRFASDLIRTAGDAGPSSIAKRMREKMEAAHIDNSYIVSAEDQRRYYQGELYSPRYLDLADRSRVEAEILTSLISFGKLALH